MDFIVGKDEKVKDIHFEDWDKELLGDKRVKDIGKYKNKEYKEFIKFLLKEKLFLKVRILWAGFPDKIVWLWSAPAIYGKAAYDETLKNVNSVGLNPSKGFFAEFLFKTQKGVLIMSEALLVAALTRMGMKSYEIEVNLTERESVEIVKDFNISRNLQAFMLIKSENRVAKLNFKGPFFVGVNLEDALEPLTAKELKALKKEELKGYKWLKAVASEDEDELEEGRRVIEKLQKSGFK